MSGLTEQAELKAAGDILSAMSGDYNPDVQMDTGEESKEGHEATEPVVTEGNVSYIISDFADNAKDSAKLAGQVKTQSLKQLSSWVKNISDGLNHVKGLIEQSRSDGKVLAENYDQTVKDFASKITSAYRKIEGNVESGLETIGLKEQLDNIMLQHEKMLFIALQLLAHKVDTEDELLEPNSDNIHGIVDRIFVNANDVDKRHIMLLIKQLFETFYYGKLGVSAVNSYNIVESDGIAGFFKRSNKDLIDNYNTNEIRKTIDSFVNIDETKLKNFLIDFIINFKNDGTVDKLDHSKYFGNTQNLPEFVESIIGLNESNINFIDFELSKKSIKTRLDYYADRFDSGGTLDTDRYAEKINALYKNYEELIDQTKTFIKGANLTDFGYHKDTDRDSIIGEVEIIAKKISEELTEDHINFVQTLNDGPIKIMYNKADKNEVATTKIDDFHTKIDVVGKKKTRREEYATTEPPSGPLPFGVVRGAPKRQGPGGGRKRKTRVAANKKRKTQKKKRPSRKMKVSRKKTQRRKKKGSKKKSMKNRK